VAHDRVTSTARRAVSHINNWPKSLYGERVCFGSCGKRIRILFLIARLFCFSREPVLTIVGVDPSLGIEDLLRARVERMACARHVELDERELFAVDLDGLFGLDRGPCDELKITRDVFEYDKAVIWVDFWPHIAHHTALAAPRIDGGGQSAASPAALFARLSHAVKCWSAGNQCEQCAAVLYGVPCEA
jgi:hypothetical protein